MMNKSFNTLIGRNYWAGRKSWTEEKIWTLMNQGGNQFVLLDPKKLNCSNIGTPSDVLQYADNEEDIYEHYSALN